MPDNVPKTRGALERILRHLDRPGLTVRSLLAGKPKAAVKHLTSTVLESGGINPAWLGIETTPEEEPSFTKRGMTGAETKGLRWWGGLAGDILTDPLTYLTLGGAGIAKGLAAGGTKAVAKQTLRSGLTGAGQKALAAAGAKEVAELAAKSPSMARLLAANPLRAKRLGEERALAKMLRLNTKEAAAEAHKAGKPARFFRTKEGGFELAPDVPKELVEQGGLKVGLPFTRGATVPGTAGVDIFQYLPPVLAAKAVGKIPLLKNAENIKNLGEYLGKKFKFGYGLKPEEMVVARQHQVARSVGRMDADAWLEQMPKIMGRTPTEADNLALMAKFEGVDLQPAMRAGALKPAGLLRKASLDPSKLTPAVEAEMRASGQRLAALVDKDPALKRVYDEFVKTHKAIFEREQELGLIESNLDFGSYLKRRYENIDEYLELAGKKTRFGKPVGGSDRGFTKYRHYDDIVDAMKAGLAPSTNPFENVRNRLYGHVDIVAKDVLERRARVLGKGAEDTPLAQWIQAGAGAIPPRGPAGEVLAAFNRVFKPAATVGIGFPTPAFHVRNILSGRFQEATHARTRIWNALKPWSLQADRVMAAINDPAKAKALQAAGNYAGEDLAAVVKNSGLLGQTFAETEQLVGQGGAGPLKKILRGATYLPGKTMQRVEGNMRVGMFLRLLEQGESPRAAAEAVRKAFVDYTMVSGAHRTVRDIIPFAQFSIGQLPTTLETIMRRPRFATPIRELYKAREAEIPVLPGHLAGQPTIPLGRGPAGPRVMSQLGTIFDDLNKLYAGNIPQTIRQSLLGAMTPAIKAPLEVVMGKDFFFGGDLTYNRTPPALQALGMGPTMDPRLRKGIQSLPGARQLGMADKILDERQAWWQKAINLLTGIKIETVDEGRAYRNLIKSYLDEKVAAGDVGVVERFYSKSMDPALAKLIKDYHRKQPKKAF